MAFQNMRFKTRRIFYLNIHKNRAKQWLGVGQFMFFFASDFLSI